ncbi:MAG: D-alanine--D-alanine ligase [Bacteroidetes bacterium HGW-Bacteroidetes-1]|jgi:D-alanine-D-alanine ligase|nr:MAG: D-alanine--D-alanine ligase [Bacteroidetes bacterium HGW-Bacteroidetes-1]
MKKLKIVILHNQLSKEAKTDEADVMQQVQLVYNCLNELGHSVSIFPLSLNLEVGRDNLIAMQPDLVFNLVESFDNKGELVYLAPALLDALAMPYTGTHTVPMFQSASKTLTKENLIKAALLTPLSFELHETELFEAGKTYILKPRWEEGSLDLDEDAVFSGDNLEFIAGLKKLPKQAWFVEEFIDGREFNCAIIAKSSGPEVLAVAEIEFIDFPKGKPRMLGYKAKWDEDSFEYNNTVRKLDFAEADAVLIEKLRILGLQCWDACSLGGYARVDFRVDRHGNPFILEVNSNPCISPDSGYYAAAIHAGYDFTDIVEWIVADAINQFKIIN